MPRELLPLLKGELVLQGEKDDPQMLIEKQGVERQAVEKAQVVPHLQELKLVRVHQENTVEVEGVQHNPRVVWPLRG